MPPCEPLHRGARLLGLRDEFGSGFHLPILGRMGDPSTRRSSKAALRVDLTPSKWPFPVAGLAKML
jgi:hypothetical protein